MAKHIRILNGPNLNMLGTREPELYGHDTLEDVLAQCQAIGTKLGFEVSLKQSNHEGQLIDWIQEARTTADGIIINPAGYSHTSVAILDALNMFDGPVIEVHVSNIHRRESFRHNSYVSLRANGVIAGCGAQGYSLAMHRMGQLLAQS
ncbi:type II 3-dehydroquinate dehydratase [Rhodobacteraceae bacterium nBUS_24]